MKPNPVYHICAVLTGLLAVTSAAVGDKSRFHFGEP